MRPADADELIGSHIGLARSLARRFANRGEQLEDLEQVAYLALVLAASRFDASRGAKFSTFAHVTILGELKRHFRDKRWGVHVSRSAQERYLAVRDAGDALTAQHGRSPSVSEVGAVTGLDPEDVVAAQEVHMAMSVVSLDAPVLNRGEPLDIGAVDRDMRKVEARIALKSALATLGDREVEIIDLRFRRGLTQAEIGAKLGMSQMHVSRLLSRSLAAVREQFDG